MTKSYTHIALLALLIVCISTKYSTTPQYTFTGISAANGIPMVMHLSGNTDRIGLISQYSTSYNNQAIFNLDGGSQQCSSNFVPTLVPLGFPSESNMLYVDALYGSIIKMSSPCGSPVTIANITATTIDIAIGSTSKQSFLVLIYPTKMTEYNIGSGAVSKEYAFNSGETPIFARYSAGRQILWAAISNGVSVKMIAFDTSSGSRKNQLAIDIGVQFLGGNDDGDAYWMFSNPTVYYVDKNGNKKSIYTKSTLQVPVGICTTDNILVNLRISGYSYTFVTYDPEDGSEIQNFPLNFIPVQFSASKQISDCNDNYITFIDSQGKFQIFEYSHPFPVWAIILIVVGGLLIIGGIVGFILYRKRQQKKAGGYQQFDQPSKNRI